MGNRKINLSESERIKMKAYICVLGLLLLFILFVAQFIFSLIPENKQPDEEHIPVIEILNNVWIMEADVEKLLIFRDGAEEEYFYGEAVNTYNEDMQGNVLKQDETEAANPREQLADIRLADDKVTDIVIKSGRINGKVLSADAEGIELEGYGRLPLAPDYKGYRLYNTLTMCTAADLPFGYNFADYVIENGAVCGILWAKEETMEYIRVLVKASDYSALLHEQVIVTADCDYTIRYGTYDNLQTEEHVAGEEVVIHTDSGYFAGERITITPGILTGKVILSNVNRSQGVPGYRGHLELIKADEGIAVINEVLLEEYLYSVVPSEMPSSYPAEALKAQAICARTYAYGHMLHAGYPQYGAHVDDSTSYQVYNNITEQESATTAVKETYGELLYTAEGSPASTYYYSTSCGMGTDANVWKTDAAKTISYLQATAVKRTTMEQWIGEEKAETGDNVAVDNDVVGALLQDEAAFAEFIKTVNQDDFEVSEGWYRWTYQVEEIDFDHILSVLQKRYRANDKLVLTLDGEEYVSKPIEELDELTELYVAKRGPGGVADELILQTKENTYKVISEYNIRAVLNNGESKVCRQDGSEVASPTLLPSAFMVIEPVWEEDEITGYRLTGGGFGHGVGMSQNAAKSMAASGYDAEQILLFFYQDCYIKSIYE